MTLWCMRDDILTRATVPRNAGHYSYAGMGYANSHAVTSVGGASYTYHKTGNVTALGHVHQRQLARPLLVDDLCQALLDDRDSEAPARHQRVQNLQGLDPFTSGVIVLDCLEAYLETAVLCLVQQLG